MKKFVEIMSINVARLDNALHARYHLLMYELVNSGKVSLSTLHIPAELMSEWLANINLEKDISREVTASLSTEDMKVIDKERCSYITFIFQSGRTAALMPFGANKEAGRRMSLLADKYAGIQDEGVERKTMHIDGLLEDLDKPENSADVDALGLREYVEALRDANKRYHDMRVARTGTRSANKLPAAKVVRPNSDGNLELVCKYIEASYLLSSSAEDKVAIAALVDNMNQQSAEIKANFNQSQSQKYGTGSGIGGDNVTDAETDVPGNETPDTTPDTGGTTPDEGGDTPEGGGSDTGNEGGTTPPTTGGGDDGDDDGEVVG